MILFQKKKKNRQEKSQVCHTHTNSRPNTLDRTNAELHYPLVYCTDVSMSQISYYWRNVDFTPSLLKLCKLQKHCVVLQSGASSLAINLWLSTDSSCKDHRTTFTLVTHIHSSGDSWWDLPQRHLSFYFSLTQPVANFSVSHECVIFFTNCPQ